MLVMGSGWEMLLEMLLERVVPKLSPGHQVSLAWQGEMCLGQGVRPCKGAVCAGNAFSIPQGRLFLQEFLQ